MFRIDEDKTIHITRGDIGCIEVSATKEDGEDYIFQSGEVLRLTVMRKGKPEEVYLQKDVTVEEETSFVRISIIDDESKIGELSGKPITCWYEIELNPGIAPQTIIGYDEDGAKELIIYPEGSEVYA